MSLVEKDIKDQKFNLCNCNQVREVEKWSYNLKILYIFNFKQKVGLQQEYFKKRVSKKNRL